jgi:diadenosine tetraphosphate (Ap4A) HIT family hydrolase
MFALDARLEADTFALGESALCALRVFDDSRYAWLVLVPRRPNSCEWFELTSDEQAALFRETMLAAQALRDSFDITKVNIGQLGNVVRQLHVHVVARRDGDPAWPGPVWGHSPRVAYPDDERERLRERLRNSALSAAFTFA